MSSFILEKEKSKVIVKEYLSGSNNQKIIMTSSFLNKYESIVIGTGNILENEEFKKAKNPTQEVSKQHFKLNVEHFAIIISACFYFFRDKNFR